MPNARVPEHPAVVGVGVGVEIGVAAGVGAGQFVGFHAQLVPRHAPALDPVAVPVLHIPNGRHQPHEAADVHAGHDACVLHASGVGATGVGVGVGVPVTFNITELLTSPES